MLDIRQGNITYIVMEHAEKSSLNEKLFAIPYQALKLDQVNQKFTLNASKEQFENAPGFDKEH